MTETKAVIKSVDMSEEMQQEAIESSTQALEKYNIEKDIAAHIKREFDKKYGATWHCIVGRNFGSYAVLQVMTIVSFGAILTRAGIFNMEKQKWLSKVNMIFFTPCLLFSNIASTISLEKLMAFWPIPAFYLVFSVAAYTASQLTSRLAGLSAAYRRFVLACVMFGNTNSLPIAIISSLAVSEAGKILFWDADDTQDAVAARGISYTLFFAIFGNLVRWSYGYSLLRKHDDDDMDSLSTDSSILASQTSSNYGTIVEEDLERQNQDSHLRPSGMPDRRLSSMTLTAQPEEPEEISKPHQEAETTRLLSTFPSLPDQQQESQSERSCVVRLARRIHGFMSPPLYAALLALLVGLTPLKSILYDKQWFLYPCFTKAIETCGRAAVPIILVCLGAQLTCISQSSRSASPAIRKPVATAIFVRMLLLPFIAIPVTIAFATYGASWSLLATDPVFITMMIVLGSSPTAINLVQITQVNGIFEEEMLRMLFWSYGVICVPVCTLLVFVALSIVDKLV
ncbi:dynein light chain 1, cytoplasmic [Syncephalastrum racemosum]|uniref:Dynein light chain 1, cytoplasmic n=1 Tax=Syncephalastrum racemosum TaxID=13706 RepID=A0A1X2HU27_SYNRA|nr:dynein light chain 1, cytoplasmic [Syncephalastrum racemosum]